MKEYVTPKIRACSLSCFALQLLMSCTSTYNVDSCDQKNDGRTTSMTWALSKVIEKPIGDMLIISPIGRDGLPDSDHTFCLEGIGIEI